MPLLSGEARGKIANAMVHFPWKGMAVVRKWLKPTNKMSPDQGDQRIFLGGTGKACGLIRPNSGHVNVSSFAQQLIDLKLVTGYNTKQSFLVQYIIGNYLTDATAYTSALSSFTNHTVYDAWENAADALSLTQFDLAYASVAPYDKGFGLYLIAQAAIALGFQGTPYALSLASWVTASISSMISDFTNT